MSTAEISEQQLEQELDLPGFPGICGAMAGIILLLEGYRIYLMVILIQDYNKIESLLQEVLDPRLKSKIFFAMIIMGVLIVTGIIFGSLTFAKKKGGTMAGKIYIFFLLIGISYSFVLLSIPSVIINSFIAVMTVISIIHYSSWFRSVEQTKRIAKKRAKGEPSRRRPKARLKRG